ncbi:carbohydrate ABC transporter permease [Paenibacillus sp. J5C_2022]|uniref:carbohydrate ABC transporter permease n=1 Tax=Paenibacillus sp. J5C2022 TaxID=2977129 RepID=UPI0021D2C0DE|nr:carbohydrate ABC transporter permease [Paenibacillus sp. J5C2022]MCU6708104.1 carbohydrate ABC transporter permease [Paenibacillus sp. J5C2022]
MRAWQKQVKVKGLAIHTVLIALGIVWVYPFVWMLFSSFKTNTELIASGIKLLPEAPQWDNYNRAWTEANFSGYFQNTVIITVATVVIVVLMCALTGYALGRVQFPGRKLFVIVITATMFMPKGYTILPIYMTIKYMGLLNSLPGVILAESSGAHVLFILLFMSYFYKLPNELEESAEMDGAGFLRTFRTVMLPLSKPMIATTAIMQFIWTWNSFFVPLIFTMNNPDLRTLAVGMYAFVGEHSVDWTGMAAAAVISIMPIIAVFVAFQRFFIEGISGSVKG